MEKIDKKIYNKKYHRADKAAKEILNAIESDHLKAGCSEFEKIMSDNNFAKELLDDMVSSENHKLYFEELQATDREGDIHNLINNIDRLKRRSTGRKLTLRIVTVAAAMMAISFAIYNYNIPDKNRKTILTQSVNTDIKEPILIFDNGDTVKIDKGKELKEYTKLTASNKRTDSSSVKLNTIIIPVGYTYKLTLSDGTKVALNAGSRLKYPTVFSGDSREVELEGEGYFDVTKSDKRFIVNSSGSKIEVFGTQFNVRTKRNGDVETVLVEGSIGFQPTGGEIFMIKPGTKLSYTSKNNSLTTESVDSYSYTAWLDNKFVYKEQSLIRVMNDIAAWYGIEVSSVRAIDDMTLTLVISRDTPIDDLMKAISMTLNINIIKEKGMEYTIE